jgi:hypothetical protein
VQRLSLDVLRGGAHLREAHDVRAEADGENEAHRGLRRRRPAPHRTKYTRGLGISYKTSIFKRALRCCETHLDGVPLGPEVGGVHTAAAPRLVREHPAPVLPAFVEQSHVSLVGCTAAVEGGKTYMGERCTWRPSRGAPGAFPGSRPCGSAPVLKNAAHL